MAETESVEGIVAVDVRAVVGLVAVVVELEVRGRAAALLLISSLLDELRDWESNGSSCRRRRASRCREGSDAARCAEADQAVGRVVRVRLAVGRVVQLPFGQLVAHPVVGVREADDQRTVGLEVALLDRAAHSVVADVDGPGVVQEGFPRAVDRVISLEHAIGADVLVHGDRL